MPDTTPGPLSRLGALPRGWAHGLEFRTAGPRAERELRRIARSGRPIVAGPWLSEVGVELLFWIPLLNGLRARYGIEPERVTAISRGGAEPWYANVAGRYLDVFDRFDPAEVRDWASERERGGTQKQKQVAAHDRAVLDAFASELPDGYELLHPSLMHRLFRRFWTWRGGENRLSTILDHVAYEPLPRPAVAPALRERLPKRYVAVKAYFNNSFPDDEPNCEFLRDLLRRLGERTEVVLLGTGLELDDHADFVPGDSARFHRLDDLMTPRGNLEVQTQVMGGADTLFATLGGFSYLAGFLGVPSFSFNSHDEFFVTTHRDLFARARRSLERAGAGAGFVHFEPRDARVLARLGERA